MKGNVNGSHNLARISLQCVKHGNSKTEWYVEAKKNHEKNIE